jgi:hypothetical protein
MSATRIFGHSVIGNFVIASSFFIRHFWPSLVPPVSVEKCRDRRGAAGIITSDFRGDYAAQPSS